MTRKLAIILGLALLCIAEAAVTIGKGGAPAVCVLPAQASLVERTAADELVKYFVKMGMDAPGIIGENDPVPGGAYPICIGWSRNAEKLTGMSAASMGYDEFVAMVEEKGAVLAGHPVRGTLYAVGHFLEKYCGVRWWSACEESVPQVKSLRLASVKEVVKPGFEGRRSPAVQFNGDKHAAGQVAWYKVHRRQNSFNIPLNMGGSTGESILCGFSITSDRFVPDEAFFNSRRGFYGPDEKFEGSKPEYFALRDGRRFSAVEGQPCLTNPEVPQVAARNIIRLANRINPTAKRVWLIQNDNTNYCECENCVRETARLGNRSDLNMKFVNEVGALVRKVYPDMMIETAAYQYTLEPPKTVRPADYVCIRVCLIEANGVKPITHPTNKRYYDALVGWTKISRNINVWHYITNFTQYGFIHPTTRALVQDIRLFNELGVRECYSEDAGESGEFSWFAVWRSYLDSTMMADPLCDAEALRQDFFRGYYGKAADAMLKLHTLYEDAAAATDAIVTCFQMDTSHWLTAETLLKGEELLKEAEAAAAGNPELEKRIFSVRMCHDWTMLWRHENTVFARITGSKPFDRQKISAMRATLKERMAKVPRNPGWRNLFGRMGMMPIDRMVSMLDDFMASPEPAKLPQRFMNVNPADLVVIPVARMNFHCGEKYIADYKAPAKVANRLNVNGWWWSALVDMPTLPPCGTWEIYAEVRLPDGVKNPAGTAFIGGVYAYGTNFAVKTAYTIPASDLSHSYRIVSLGTTDFHRDGQIYFGGVANKDVPEILVSRIFLKRAGK